MVSESNLFSRLCPTYLRITRDHTGVLPGAAILTGWQDGAGIQSWGWSARPGLDSIIERIYENSSDYQPVNLEKLKTRDFIVTRQPVKPYFEGQLTDLKKAERELLEKSGYTIDECFYFAIPYPSDVAPEGFFFLFAKNAQEADRIEKNMLVLQNAIREVNMVA